VKSFQKRVEWKKKQYKLKRGYVRYTVLLICLIAAGIHCEKFLQNPDQGGGNDQTLEGFVVRAGTHNQVGGATVELQACSNYDIELGCVQYTAVAMVTTDTNGSFKFKSSLNAEDIL
jgi:hypothetical protein